MRIDHAQVGRRIIADSFRIGPGVRSDHRALILDFRIERQDPSKVQLRADFRLLGRDIAIGWSCRLR